ncbi:hypothetical protein QOT17_008591 [Balamuthia mandrillaris]
MAERRGGVVGGGPGGEKARQLQAALRGSLWFACLEAFLCIVEFTLVMFGLAVVHRLVVQPFVVDPGASAFAYQKCASLTGVEPAEFQASKLPSLLACLMGEEWRSAALQVASSCACTAALLGWMWWRFIRPLVVRGSYGSSWIGLDKLPRLSKLAMYLLAYQLCSFLFYVYLYSALRGGTFLSLDNYLSPVAQLSPTDADDSPSFRFDFVRAVHMLFLDPLKEELVFRGCILLILWNRSKDARRCALLSSVFFGLFHLINLASSHFSKGYVLFQIALGMEIGLFYSLQVMATSSLWESVLLHITNNVLSSLMSATQTPLFADPLLLFSVLQTVVVYCWLDMKLLRSGDNTIVDHPSTKRPP